MLRALPKDDTLLNWATLRRAIFGTDVVVNCELLHRLIPRSPETLTHTRVGGDARPEGVVPASG
jgi:hypothetical protein